MNKLLVCFIFLILLLGSVNLQEGPSLCLENNQQTGVDTDLPNSIVIDGIISEDEYENQVTYQNLEIYWSNDQNHIYMALKGKTQGYISIGIQPGSMMRDSDIILGYIKDEKVEIFDQYSTGDFGPHPSDAELGGTNDILAYAGKETDGFTVIEFKRLLKTEDQYDLELKPGKNKIIWAYSNQDSLQVRHSTRGYGEIEIKVED